MLPRTRTLFFCAFGEDYLLVRRNDFGPLPAPTRPATADEWRPISSAEARRVLTALAREGSFALQTFVAASPVLAPPDLTLPANDRLRGHLEPWLLDGRSYLVLRRTRNVQPPRGAVHARFGGLSANQRQAIATLLTRAALRYPRRSVQRMKAPMRGPMLWILTLATLGCPGFRGSLPGVDGGEGEDGGATPHPHPGMSSAEGGNSAVSTDAPLDGSASPSAARGERCTTGAACATGFCVDGFCCERACSAPCEACDLPGSVGSCAQVTTGQPRNKPECPGAGECKGQCAAGTVQCQFPRGIACGTATCAGTALIKPGTCDGAGSCRAGPSESCGSYLCVKDRCLTSCSMRDDCALNHFCDVAGGACLSRALQVSAGAFHTCARLGDGSAWCWGKNDDRQIGVDTGGLPATKPVEIRALNGQLEFISAGARNTCGVLIGGKVVCWGAWPLGTNEGPDTKRFDARPVQTISRVDLTGARALCTGFDHACALRPDGVWCWGGNGAGQLGTGDPSSVAVAVHSLKDPEITSIHCGVGTTAAVKRGTGVFTWGMGVLDARGSAMPALTSNLSIYGVGSGDRLSCYWLSNASLHCATNRSAPYETWRAVFGNVVDFAVSSAGACSTLGTGELSCWLAGEGGTATQPNASGLNGLSSHAYGDHYCGLSSHGSVVCWGSNFHGQLGIGSSGEETEKPPAAVRWR